MKKTNLSLFNSKGGALLYAIITAFVLSFIGASIVMLTVNQYKIIDNEINRKEAYYLLRAGMEYANYKLRDGSVIFEENEEEKVLSSPDDLTNIASGIKIRIFKLNPGEFSDYKVEVSTTY